MPAQSSSPVSDAERQERIKTLQVKLGALDTFRVRGGLGFWSDDEQGTASFVWEQSVDQLDINVTAPLGLGQVRLQQREGQATLKRGALVEHASSIDALLASSLNLPAKIPVFQLSQWMRGLPGNAGKVKYDESGRLESATYTDQSGSRWFAKVLGYGEYENTPVPRLIIARSGHINLRVTLKEWTTAADLASSGSLPERNSPAGGSRPGRLQIPGR